ncbi:hypothetical protein ES703_47506 [subsurface metagenome]
MITGFITAVVRDRDGKVIGRERHKLRSYVRAYNHLLNAQARTIEGPPDPAITTKDTGNTERNIHYADIAFRCNAPIGTTTYGIRVGTDNTAVDIEQYALIAEIAQGSGAGQMEHQAVVFTDIGVAANVCSFEVERVILNNSLGVINVAEGAIYCQGKDTLGTTRYFMIARDLITLAVPDGGAITVTYTLRVVA